LLAWLRSGQMLAAPRGSLCVNLGQTRFAFLRDAVPLLVGRMTFERSRITVSLHGSLFMAWSDGSWDVRVFRGLLRLAGTVTVLGERQRARLLALGLDEHQVRVVVNSCAVPPIATEEVTNKQAGLLNRSRPVRLLHLSSLIATKGFPEYLEALKFLAHQPGPPLEAVLCGRLTASEFQNRFEDESSAAAWIEGELVAINRSGRVSVRWVRGAVGTEKEALFRACDVFVLPTRYAVEAQPIVLLEAMASGCAIVTTAVGEIPTILDKSCALLLGEVAAPELGAILARLTANPRTMTQLAAAAYERYAKRYQLAQHLDGWEERLNPERRAADKAAVLVGSKS
jgi:glycosyltransferase involved in cell wall biosynthesis